MKSSILHIEDMEIGQFITVLNGKKIPERTIFHSMTGVSTIQAAYEDPSYKGKVLEIVAIDLPFIVVKPYYSRVVTDNFSFDVREGTEFKVLSKEYVKQFKIEK